MLILSLIPTAVIFSVMAIKKCINKDNIRRIIKLFLLGLLSMRRFHWGIIPYSLCLRGSVS